MIVGFRIMLFWLLTYFALKDVGVGPWTWGAFALIAAVAGLPATSVDSLEKRIKALEAGRW